MSARMSSASSTTGNPLRRHLQQDALLVERHCRIVCLMHALLSPLAKLVGVVHRHHCFSGERIGFDLDYDDARAGRSAGSIKDRRTQNGLPRASLLFCCTWLERFPRFKEASSAVFRQRPPELLTFLAGKPVIPLPISYAHSLRRFKTSSIFACLSFHTSFLFCESGPRQLSALNATPRSTC
jgi:hypothetical protein